MAVQVSIASDIISRLSLYASRKEKLSDFEFHSLKREVEKTKKDDVSGYYMLLGMLYAIQRDYKTAREYHERSIAAGGGVVEYMNFGLSLRRLGRSDESLKYLLCAHAVEPNSRKIAEEIFSAMVFCGDFSAFDTVTERLLKTSSDLDIDSVSGASTVMEIRADLREAEIAEDDFKLAMSAVERVVASRGFLSRTCSVVTGDFDGVAHVYAEIAVDGATAAELASVNDAVADAVIELDDLAGWDRVVINVVSSADVDIEHGSVVLV